VSEKEGAPYACGQKPVWKDDVVYYVVEVVRWCIALQCGVWMRLTYQRDYVPERQVWRDFLVSADLISPAIP
jgi:hypothetical protein